MRSVKKIYGYVLTLPDRCYPFACKVGGRRVRGRLSYERAATRAFKKYGVDRLGFKLTLYREIFHFTGSVLFIILATAISKNFFGSGTALYVLFGAAVVALAYQEFYVHPKKYGQHPNRGIVDWLAWVVPIALYAFFFSGGTM